MTTTGSAATAEEIRTSLLDFVERHAKAPVTPDLDLFGSGLVSSLFALQLVMRVESEFGVTVDAPDLKLDNFRTVDAITGLVLRLRGTGDG
jgi:methoxymalonate biosynthesis acyl carrier protein